MFTNLLDNYHPVTDNMALNSRIISSNLLLSKEEKKVYGFRKMIRGESPRIIFNIIMTRCEEDYNPTIVVGLKEIYANENRERSNAYKKSCNLYEIL